MSQVPLIYDLEGRPLNEPPHRHSPLDRRRFLITSGLSVAGLVLYPAHSAHASPIFGAVARFAWAVGASVLSNLITSYIRENYLSASFAQEIRRTNTRMSQLGFNQLDESTVYGPEGSYIIYPARRGSDGFNACAAFMDGSRSQGSQRIALIEGPTLLGIGELAASVRRRGASSRVVRNAILPRSTIESQGVSMQRSFSGPDIYRTDEGNVRARYTTNGRGRGTVTVEARNERGTLLAGGDYDVTYNTAE